MRITRKNLCIRCLEKRGAVFVRCPKANLQSVETQGASTCGAITSLHVHAVDDQRASILELVYALSISLSLDVMTVYCSGFTWLPHGCHVFSSDDKSIQLLVDIDGVLSDEVVIWSGEFKVIGRLFQDRFELDVSTGAGLLVELITDAEILREFLNLGLFSPSESAVSMLK